VKKRILVIRIDRLSELSEVEVYNLFCIYYQVHPYPSFPHKWRVDKYFKSDFHKYVSIGYDSRNLGKPLKKI